MADKGTPDIIACLKGHFVGIEVKKDEKAYKKWKKANDSTSLAQHMQCEMITEAGGIYIVAYDVEQAEEDLKELSFI